MPLVTLFGGSGFVGRYAAQAFARAGWRVRVAVRRPNEAGFMRTYGDVGQVVPVQANIRDDASVAQAVAGADVVVNLVGLMFEDSWQSFESVQREGAARVARASAAAGVGRLIQVSALGADADSKSDYARTKAQGEAAVREAFPGAVIMRPSIIFGVEDDFFNRFASMSRFTPALPLIGGSTRFQPVYVVDVAQAIARAAEAPAESVEGKVFELGGPTLYSFKELMKLVLRTVRRRRLLVPVPFFVANINAWFLDLFGALPLVKNTILTQDQVKLLQHDNVVSAGAPGLAELGIAPHGLEAVLPSYLWRFRPQGQYSRPMAEA